MWRWAETRGLNTQSHYNAAQLADLKAEAAVPVFTSEAVASA